MTSPALPIPVPTTEPLFLPTLPASAPKVAGPVTSQLAATAAAQFFQTAGIVPDTAAPAPRPRRSRKALVALAVVVALTMVLS